MNAIRAHLVRRDAQIVLLLATVRSDDARSGLHQGYLPAFGRTAASTHAAIWTVIALARLGMGDEAMELFHMINPINHMRTAEDTERYRAEPYAVAADVYAPDARRPRWLDVYGFGGMDVPRPPSVACSDSAARRTMRA